LAKVKLRGLVGLFGGLLIIFALLVGFGTGFIQSEIGGLFSDKIAHENSESLRRGLDPVQAGRITVDALATVGGLSLGLFLLN